MVDATLGYPRFNALPSRMRRADEKERLQDKKPRGKELMCLRVSAVRMVSPLCA